MFPLPDGLPISYFHLQLASERVQVTSLVRERGDEMRWLQSWSTHWLQRSRRQRFREQPQWETQSGRGRSDPRWIGIFYLFFDWWLFLNADMKKPSRERCFLLSAQKRCPKTWQYLCLIVYAYQYAYYYAYNYYNYNNNYDYIMVVMHLLVYFYYSTVDFYCFIVLYATWHKNFLWD